MAITTIKASKSTPVEAIKRITDKGEAVQVSTYLLIPYRDLAHQMMETAKIWGKAQKRYFG